MPGERSYHFPCASCGRTLTAPAGQMGEVGRCPVCRAEFRIGSVAGGPVSPADAGPGGRAHPDVERIENRSRPRPSSSGADPPRRPLGPPSDPEIEMPFELSGEERSGSPDPPEPEPASLDVADGAPEPRERDKRRKPRFEVKDGLVRLPWGPFKGQRVRLVLDDLSVGGLKCHGVDVILGKPSLQLLTKLLRSGKEVRVLVDVPAFETLLLFRARLKRVEVNRGARRVEMAFQFTSASPESLKKLHRLADSPIIRSLIRNLS